MPFGDADGWIPAEGVAAILLKPLSQAMRDRDHIYAVIKSSALGQEGKTSWFSAFSPKRQADFLQRSFERAGISPATISYVEAAANGSPLGDAIELEGLAKAFRQWTQRDGCCPIGTVKANAGHGESVSTLLQLTKVLLQFKAGEIYPLPHPERRNPNIRIQETPFRFPALTEAWDRPTFLVDGKRFSVPRRASISSFGGGGNMGHLILEEAPPGRDGPDPLASYLIPLSAQNPEQLPGKAADLLAFFDHLETLDAHWAETYGLIHIMHTLWLGRMAQAQRVAFVVADLEELKNQCQRFLRQEPHPGIIVQGQGVAGNLDVPGLIESQNWPELGRQWVSGREIPWGHFFESKKANRVPLPGYRFDRKRHEISPEAFRRKGGNPIPEKTVPRPAGGLRPRAEESNLIRIVKAAFAKVLPAGRESLDLARPLDQYGFDSAMVVGVAAELEKHFTRVPPTLFFECGTIGDVVECLRQASPGNGGLANEASRAIASPAEESSGKAFNIDQVVEDILSYRLSAEQVLERLE